MQLFKLSWIQTQRSDKILNITFSPGGQNGSSQIFQIAALDFKVSVLISFL